MRLPHLATLALAAALASGSAEVSAVTVTVEPSDTTVTLGASVTLRLVADAFADLKGYQLIYAYDPVRLTFGGALAGDVLTGTPGAYTDYVVPDAAAPADSVWFDAAKLEGSTSGPGVLAYVTFATMATGDAHVQCRSVDFRDSANAQTLPGCAGGVIRITGPVAVPPSTWGRVKSLYR